MVELLRVDLFVELLRVAGVVLRVDVWVELRLTVDVWVELRLTVVVLPLSSVVRTVVRVVPLLLTRDSTEVEGCWRTDVLEVAL